MNFFLLRTAAAFAGALSFAAAAGAQTRSAPRISETYPPPEDLRKPDRTITAGGNGPVAAITYNANGRLLAAACGDNTIRVYDARPGEQSKGQLLQTLAGHTGRILAVGFSGADSNVLVSVSADRTVRTWDVTAGKLIRSATLPFDQPVRNASISPGKEPILAVGSAHQVRLWDYQKHEPVKRMNLDEASLATLAFSPDGKELALGTDGTTVLFWGVDVERSLRPLTAGPNPRALAVSGTHVVTSFGDGSVTLQRIDGTGLKGLNLLATDPVVNAVAFSPKGEQVACARADRTVKVWDVETGKLLCSQEGHAGEVVSVAFSPNGQKLASGGADGGINYWTVPLPPIPPGDLEKIKAALPAKAAAKPKKPRKVLVFWRADAILHKGGVPAANHALELMGNKTGAFEADFSRDYEVFDPQVLAQYDALVMNSTAHLALPDDAKPAYLDFAKRGGGVVGIHAAIDMFRDWPDGAKVIGATFGNHPWGPGGTWAVKLEEPDHPLLRAFGGKNFRIRDEFYEMWDPYTRADRRVLLSVDLSDPATAGVKGLRRTDRDFALSWIKRYGEGRVFYCDFGHIGEPFQNPAVLQYYLDGIQYALGDLAVDDTPGPEKKP